MTNEVLAISQTCAALGIPPEDCDPKGNILTFGKWIAQGRVVRKGQKACAKVPVIIERKTKSGKIKKYPKRTALFHITQTEEMSAEDIEKRKAKTKERPDRVFVSDQTDFLTSYTETPAATSPAAKFRTMADKLQKDIDHKMADRPTHTTRMMAHASAARSDGERLKRTQAALIALADLWDADAVPECLQDLRSKKAVNDLTACKSTKGQCGYYHTTHDQNEPYHDTEQARAIFALLTPKSDEELKAEDLKKRVDDLQFSNIPGYFPTPDAVIELMIEKADLMAYQTVLEPSAGHGAICDALGPHCVTVTAIEQNHTLCKILEDKGYPVSGEDFMQYNAKPDNKFDRVIMNPPFEKLQDVDHVRHAFDQLNEGGRVVAIMSPAFTFRTDAKCTAFRDFVDEHGEWEKLPEGSFKASGTSVATVIVTLDK